MQSIFKLIAGIAFSVLVAVYFITRFMLDIIGYTTAPDDFDLLQKRMPAMLEWLFSTPWWMAAFFQLAVIAIAAWLIVSGTRRAASDEIEEHPSLDRDQVSALVEESLNAHREEAPDSQLLEIAESLEKVRRSASAAMTTALELNKQKDVRIAEIARGCADLERSFQDWSSQHSDSTRQRFNNLNASFAAIGHWLWHCRHFPALLGKGDQLRALPEVEMTDEIWESWSDTEKAWRSDVEQWASVAQYYAPNTKNAIFEIREELLYGEWSFDQSKLGSDAPDRVHRYKVMALILDNMRGMREHIERCIQSAAFDGASNKSGPLGVSRPGRPSLPQ